ncbi:MAG: hypothetical protein EOP11_26725 [Proteobacteria bacterium]|nr:MAG: hypothetical protein EOP11_26725 [Pseudomonadota bacterium]
MTRIIFLACATLSLGAACSATRTLVGPDGTEHRLVSCGAIENCYQEARKDCRGNYDIVNTTAETTTSPNGMLSVQNLLIKCQGAKPIATAPTTGGTVTN